MARKKRRVAPAEDEEAARRKFLEALEAQRANARLRSVEKPVDTQAAAAPAAVLPGFYYDEAKKRYFRSSPASERRQREQLELQQQEIQLAEQKSPVKVKIRRGYGFGVNGHNWVDYLAQRQSDFSWSARGRDRRELTPQLLSGLLPEPGTASPSQSVLPIVSFDIDGVITELEWRPVRELDLLVCSLGSGRRNTQRASGGVSYMRVGDQSSGGRAVISSTAAYVDGVRQLGSILRAPTGTITSDVHAQSFYSTGQVVLNGTKDGGLWGWDLRCPSRIYEWAADVVAGQPAGSVLDVHVLNDSRRAVVHRSNGELRLLDLRNCKPVVEFVSGLPKRYLQNLRCAVDTHETVVVAGGDTQHPQAVNSYELQHGRCVASLEVKPTRSSSVHEKRSTLVQQVQLKSGLYDSRYADTPEIWALSRNELYICSGRTNDPTE
ncbi:hypothetical protein ON010_g5498 [Phytophthora cinnamomi]|nr:hypothetical protein ON010_g5498 [Phytophthora cinnamomi]